MPLLALAALVTLPQANGDIFDLLSRTPAARSDLAFDDIWPRKPYTGKTAVGLSWSPEGRYLAYLWNPYDEPGTDLWLYDTREGKSIRVTDIDKMAEFDPEPRKAKERYKKDKEIDEKLDKMSDAERRKYDLEEKEKVDKARDTQSSYGGVSEFAWAKDRQEILFVFKGDVYRWKVGDSKFARLTKTRETESQVQWTKDSGGYFCRRGDGVFRVRFDSGVIEQLNPDMSSGTPLWGYSISPDETKLMVSTGRTSAAYRQVDYITYRGRFAEARKTSQYWGFADNPVQEEQYLYLYDLTTPASRDPRPWEVWSYKGGEDVWGTSLSDKPWSPDSKKFVFARDQRNDGVVEVVVADLALRKLDTVYKATILGEPSSNSMVQPFYTASGEQIVAMLEASGWRHPWLIDPLRQTVTQLTKGAFEVYPIRCSKDGKWLYVRSSKEDLARLDIYRVPLAGGEMERLTKRDGTYGQPEVSPDDARVALTFGSWEAGLPELYVLPVAGGREVAVTRSHRDGFWNMIKLKPSLFTYKNRHGQTIHGYMFLPPGWKKTDRRPLMIYVYGGPLGSGHSVWDGTFGGTDYRFNMYLSYALGFVTVTIDPRGQSNYGAAFGRANFEQAGKPQTEDLADGAKFLIENYGVDPKRVAINGWSFGGFQTQMCMFTAPEVFTLGIAGAGPTEWQNYNNGYTENVIGRARPGHPEDLDKYSLTHLAKNLRSPLLLLHGVEDTNVLFQHTIAVYRKLLQYGKGDLVELAIDPTGGHGMGGDMSARDRHAIYLAFILKHWGHTLADASSDPRE